MPAYRVWFTDGSAQVVEAKNPKDAALKGCLAAARTNAQVYVEDLPGVENEEIVE